MLCPKESLRRPKEIPTKSVRVSSYAGAGKGEGGGGVEIKGPAGEPQAT